MSDTQVEPTKGARRVERWRGSVARPSLSIKPVAAQCNLPSRSGLCPEGTPAVAEQHHRYKCQKSRGKLEESGTETCIQIATLKFSGWYSNQLPSFLSLLSQKKEKPRRSNSSLKHGDCCKPASRINTTSVASATKLITCSRRAVFPWDHTEKTDSGIVTDSSFTTFGFDMLGISPSCSSEDTAPRGCSSGRWKRNSWSTLLPSKTCPTGKRLYWSSEVT